MEPKSIHTWLDLKQQNVSGYDVDVQITEFPENANPRWLYFFALQVNFSDHNEGSHGGFQWAFPFNAQCNKGVNWGGYPDVGSLTFPFTWELNTWYRYRVSRLDHKEIDRTLWQFEVMNYSSNATHYFGTIRTRSKAISGAVVFTETGYGVQCATPSVRVEWRAPCFRTPESTYAAPIGIANYNGTCADPSNTNQSILVSDPPHWFHQTNVQRTTQVDKVLWGKR